MAVDRFAVDKMLGRLATWLRLLGYDATYGSHLGGLSLVRHARAEGRTILTRDHRLQRQAIGVPLLLVDSDHFREQLRQVIAAFGLDPLAHPFTRCARCNAVVQPVPKAAIATRVPPYVLATQNCFVACPNCHRVYWPATHHELISRELGRLLSPTSAS